MKAVLYLLFSLLCLWGCREQKKEQRNSVSIQPVSAEKKSMERYLGTLAEIQSRGVLRVLTPSNIDAAFPRKGNLLSFELQMAEEFARELGVRLEVIPISEYNQFITALSEGRGDISMASLTVTESRKEKVCFSKPLDYVHEVLVGSVESTAKGLRDLTNDTVSVRKSSAYFETLRGYQDSLHSFHIKGIQESLHTYEIVEKVAAGTYGYTLCDSDIAETVLSYEKGLKKICTLGRPRARAWALAKETPELLEAVNGFITKHALSRSRLEKAFGDLTAMQKRKFLRVAVRNNAATYWIHKGKEVGFEYDLVQAFARSQGLRLEMVVAPDRASLITWVLEGRADMAASGITITDERKEQVAFGAPYLFPKEVVVCGKDSSGAPLIRSVDELFNYPIHIRKSSAYHETLLKLEKEKGQKLNIEFVSEELETENIISKVASGEFTVTLADDYLAQMELLYRDNLVLGPTVSEAEEIGWIMRKSAPELQAAVSRFFTSGEYKPKALKYNMLYNRYFKNRREILAAKSDSRADMKGVISPYDSLMKDVANTKEFNWYMLAAQAYQESKFNPRARSWVGALGLMQLMPLTAKEVGVTNREDPYQSLRGGARYMEKLLKRFDETIPYEERYRFALASYNAGYGHVLDARRLAKKLGYDNRSWFDNVEKAMLLLEKPAYAKRARYGYCRGSEPVTYVRNIQRLFTHYSQVEQ